MLQRGHETKYTASSVCFTETPSLYLRWLSQQIRWSKSFFREWLFNSMWWHKHHVWMAYESIVSGAFPFFVTATVITMFWSGRLWSIVWILLSIQGIGLVKGFFACLIRRSPVMFFVSLYSCLYMTSLLPAKFFAMVTMTKKGWGTSGRKTLLKSYNALIPVVVWGAVLIPGLLYTATVDIQKAEDKKIPQKELLYILVGCCLYLAYWFTMITIWKDCIQKHHTRKADLQYEGE